MSGLPNSIKKGINSELNRENLAVIDLGLKKDKRRKIDRQLNVLTSVNQIISIL